MDSEKFEVEIQYLFEYYRQKPPTRNQILLWLDEIDYIPNNAVDWICGWIKSEFDNVPRNIGKAFMAGYYQWPGKKPIIQDQVVPDKITGGWRWHSDPDGTEYISFKEFLRRFPAYAKKWEQIQNQNKDLKIFGKPYKTIGFNTEDLDKIPF